MEKIEGTLVKGLLGKIIPSYRIIYACHQAVRGFDNFSTDAIIYAKLEWSKYLRDTYDEKSRIKYLWEKCFEYDSPNIRIPIIDVDIDEIYGIEILVTEHPKKVMPHPVEEVAKKGDDGLPF
jgi:hypothetical protein